jgi:hypothetical protein
MVDFLSIVKITGMDLGFILISLPMWAFLSARGRSRKFVVIFCVFFVLLNFPVCFSLNGVLGLFSE